MECKVIILCTFYLVFASVQAIKVNLNKAWKQDLGWEINCSWVIPEGDSLQSVRLYQNNQQFLIYRPETDGASTHVVYRRIEDKMSTSCAVLDDARQKGTCVISLELYQPQRFNVTMACEVSGERPYFIIQKEEIVVEKLVPPTDAVFTNITVDQETGRVTLTCGAEGVPLPHLTWTIADQKVPSDFAGGDWNATSKLWHAWSVFSYTPTSSTVAVCTPTVISEGKTRTIKTGHAAKYNEARNIQGGVFNTIVTVLLLFLLR
ncbi:hypothetical protein PYW07_012413 [Mythimna separata]|uniref:Ig-like domain-containing protein n=1 Tax=Mythimna separata TaxID=271217 RepID=A0AAD7YNB3_MYTSE|nr:hypothetical protein PYW07_012413 [Mythimna separata]